MAAPESSTDGIRLNRFLASCGIASRRKCETLITDGRIMVNGKICKKLATRIRPGDKVHADGVPLKTQEALTILLFKPAHVICSAGDTHGRRTIFDLLSPKLQQANLHHVGRLDHESEGLIVMTNSGDLSHQITHPRHKIEKEYFVRINRPFQEEIHSRKLLEGIETPEGFAKAVSVVQISHRQLSVVLQQGLKRQIRHMFSALEYEVTQLVRTRIGNLSDEELKPGKFRYLKESDIARILAPPKNPASQTKR